MLLNNASIEIVDKFDHFYSEVLKCCMKLFIHIVIVLWIWLLLPSGLGRSFSVRLYSMILFWYLYCHSPGFINWSSSVMPKLSKFKLFESMIFGFFAFLFSFFFYITNMPSYVLSDYFAFSSAGAADVTLLFYSSSISLLCPCCFHCAQCQHHDLYVYSC